MAAPYCFRWSAYDFLVTSFVYAESRASATVTHPDCLVVSRISLISNMHSNGVVVERRRDDW